MCVENTRPQSVASMQSLVDHPYVFGVLLGLALAIAIEAGQKVSTYARIQDDPHRREQMVAIRDGHDVLVSLLLGFTLTLAVPRFNERRALVIGEADAIETTFLRAATLPQPYNARAQQQLRGGTLMHGWIWTPQVWTPIGLRRLRSGQSKYRRVYGRT